MLGILLRLLPKPARRLEARLQGVAGFTGSGVFRYALSPAGSANYEADLKGVAGVACELFVQGEFVAPLQCDGGKVSAKFDSRLGDPAIRLETGEFVEIKQNGCAILAGALKAAKAEKTRADILRGRRNHPQL